LLPSALATAVRCAIVGMDCGETKGEARAPVYSPLYTLIVPSANPDVTRFDGYTRFGGADSGEEVRMPKKSTRSGYSEEFKVEASQLVCSPTREVYLPAHL